MNTTTLGLPGTVGTAILRIWRDDTVIHFTAMTDGRCVLFDLTASGIGSTLVLEGMRAVARRELTSRGYAIVEES